MTLGALLALGALQVSAPAPGDRLAPFTLQDAAGAPVNWRPGRAAVITFCAFWCDTWKEQTKRLQGVSRALGPLPVEIIGISVDGRWSEVGLKKAGMRFLLDPGGAWTARQGVDRVPYTFVVDAQGAVHWATSGVVRSSDVVNAVQSALRPRPATGKVYLTFDDFPSPGADDEELLDVLRAEGVPATFFCIGSSVRRERIVVRRALREGHSLQVHAWEHDARDVEMERCQRVLREVAGASASLLRPPGSERIKGPSGWIEVRVVNPYDFQRPGTKEIVRRTATRLQPGSVIQLHSGVDQTVQALPEIIRQARKRGLSFGVLR